MEQEKGGCIPFLDVLVTCEKDHLTTTVYRKPTHTDRYIPFSSHHHQNTPTGVMRCMKNRAQQVCDAHSRSKEMEHLGMVFQKNGFPKELVQKTLYKPSSQGTRDKDNHTLPEEERPKVLCTPYVRGLSERIDKVSRPLGVKTVFKPMQTLRQTLTKVKTEIPKEKRRQLFIGCKDCNQVYIGEAKRNLKVRLTEHRQAVKKGDNKNRIAVHVQNSCHNIDWDNAEVQQVVPDYWKRRTTEALQIHRHPSIMHLDPASFSLHSGSLLMNY